MESLVESILSVEQEADAVMAEAHAAAAETEKRAVSEAAEYARAATDRAKERLASARAEAESAFRLALAEAEAELARTLQALDELPEAALGAQVARIVARFRES